MMKINMLVEINKLSKTLPPEVFEELTEKMNKEINNGATLATAYISVCTEYISKVLYSSVPPESHELPPPSLIVDIHTNTFKPPYNPTAEKEEVVI